MSNCKLTDEHNDLITEMCANTARNVASFVFENEGSLISAREGAITAFTKAFDAACDTVPGARG